MNLYLFFAILACRICAKSIYSLSIKKIAIVGCGPAGLMLAASLKRLNCGVAEVFLFDKRSDVLNIGGGGLQISGGSVVMAKIGLLDEIINTGHPLHNVLARNSQSDVLLNLDIKQLVTTKAKEELCINDKPVIFSIMRNALQNILYNAAMASDNEKCSVKIIKNAKCKNIVENSNKVSLEFDNNEKYDDFDMVFGTDGVNSVVRSFTSSGDQKYFSLPTAKGDNAFTGIRITYCVSGVDNDFTLRPNGASTFHQFFGDGLYVLAASYGGLSGIQHMLAIVYYDDKTNDLKVNPDWVTSENPKEIVLNRLVSAGLGDNQEIINLLNGCDANGFIDLAVTDETIPLKSWSSDSNRIILAGDAAHPMAPFLGAGCNQALQDAFYLANAIKSINEKHNVVDGENDSAANLWLVQQEFNADLKDFVMKYQLKRKVPTALLSVKANLLGRIETQSGTFGMLFRDIFFRLTYLLGIVEKVYLSGAKPVV